MNMYKLKQIVVVIVNWRTAIIIIMLIEMNVTTWDDMLIYLKNMEIMLRITQNHCFNVYTQKLLICCECIHAVSSVLSVWISCFPLFTHIFLSRSFPLPLWFCGFPLPLWFPLSVFSLAGFLVCFFCACSWDKWVARPSVAGSFFYIVEFEEKHMLE